MSYINDICTPLIKTLERSSALQSHQLAGYAANLDFWMYEVRHCLQVIDGYDQRFERMKTAEQLKKESENIAGMPLQRGVKDNERKELRQKLCMASGRFLERCLHEGLLEPEVWQKHDNELHLWEQTIVEQEAKLLFTFKRK